MAVFEAYPPFTKQSCRDVRLARPASIRGRLRALSLSSESQFRAKTAVTSSQMVADRRLRLCPVMRVMGRIV